MEITDTPEQVHPEEYNNVKERPRQSLALTIAKNTLVVTLGSGALKAINFLFNVYVIRRLGDDRFGQYSVVLAFVGIYQVFAELGVSQFVMRESAKNRAQAEPLFWNLVAVRAILAVIAMVAMPLIAYGLGYSQLLVIGVFLFAFSFLLSAVMVPLQGVLTAYERFDLVTAMNILGQVVFVIFGAAFLFSGLNYIWLIVASTISLIPQIGVGLWGVIHNKMLTMKVQFQPGTWYGLVRSGLPFGVISLTLSLAFKVDTIILKGYQSDQVVGWYNAAYNLVFSLLFFTAAFKDAIVPSLTRTFVTDPQQVERWYYRTVKLMTILALPMAVGGMLLAGPLVHMLYSEEYAPSALALQILIWDVPFLMFTSFCGNISTIINQEKQAAQIYAINAAVNVLLNLYFIPRYGLVAAAVLTVVTDLVGTIQFFFLLRKRLHLPSISMIMLKTIAAVLVMAGALLLARGSNLFLLIGLGVVVYGALVLVLRLLDQTEWSLIGRLLGR